MSTENNLPPELTGFEARLRAQPLEATSVDRDQLMYQAGWAAAEANRKTTWLWPTTSGVLAASLLLLTGLLLRSETISNQLAEVQEVSPTVVESKKESLAAVPAIEEIRETKPRWRSSLQVKRLLDRHRKYAQPASFAENDAPPRSQSITARQLMLDILEKNS